MFNTLVAILDRTRRVFWRLLFQLGISNHWVRDRSARLTLLASIQILLAFLCTLFAPLWMLLLGPLLLGVPHVISDVRYLLIRPPKQMSRLVVTAILLPLTAMTILRVSTMLGGPWLAKWEMACGGIAVVGVMGFATRATHWRWPLFTVATYLSWLAFVHPQHAILWVGHLHNFIAFGLWLYWSKGEGPWRRYIGVAWLYLMCIAALGLGVFERVSSSVGAFSAPSTGLHFGDLAQTLAPGINPTWGLRMVLIFAFAQAVHYTVWLRLVPGNQTFYPPRGPSTFRRNFERLRKDFGKWGLILCIEASILVPCFGIYTPTNTRNTYLSLVLFHGWLEIAVIAHLLVNRNQSIENNH